MSGKKEIWEYVYEGDLEGVKKRVELKGKDIINNEKNSLFGDTALIYASYYGQLPIVQYLISNGANINDKNIDGFTALHYACRPNESISDSTASEIIKTLIANGANETIRSNDKSFYKNKTPAEIAKNDTLRNALNQAVQDKRNGRLESYVLSAVDVSEKGVEKVIERAIVTPVTSVTTTTTTRRGRKPNVAVESEAANAPIEAASSATATSRRRPAKEQAITPAPVSITTRSKRTVSAAKLDNTTFTSTEVVAEVASPIVKKSRLAAANRISEAEKSTRTKKSSSSKSSDAIVEDSVKRSTRSSRK